jgi:hypothetical protein
VTVMFGELIPEKVSRKPRHLAFIVTARKPPEGKSRCREVRHADMLLTGTWVRYLKLANYGDGR